MGGSIILGALGLYFGAEWLVEGGASLARRYHVSLLVIGLVIVGYGSGTPELVVSIDAAFSGRGDIALGNVIGSNIANVGLVMAVTLLFLSQKKEEECPHAHVVLLIAVTLLLIGLLYTGMFTRWKGIGLLCGLIVYTFWTVSTGRKVKGIQDQAEIILPKRGRNLFGDLLKILGGLGFLLLGGRIFLNGAITLAQTVGFSDATIGLTVVAIGTSLPELSASIVAVLRGHPDLAIGNVVGSCLFNILGIVGITASLQPFYVIGITSVDCAVMLLMACCVYGVVYLGSFTRRLLGATMLGVYGIYLATLIY